MTLHPDMRWYFVRIRNDGPYVSHPTCTDLPREHTTDDIYQADFVTASLVNGVVADWMDCGAGVLVTARVFHSLQAFRLPPRIRRKPVSLFNERNVSKVAGEFYWLAAPLNSDGISFISRQNSTFDTFKGTDIISSVSRFVGKRSKVPKDVDLFFTDRGYLLVSDSIVSVVGREGHTGLELEELKDWVH